jgi:hypothetical protein
MVAATVVAEGLVILAKLFTAWFMLFEMTVSLEMPSADAVILTTLTKNN